MSQENDLDERLLPAADVGWPLQIEFFGLPGCGKTTLANELFDILSRTRSSMIFGPSLIHDTSSATKRTAAKLYLISGTLCRRGAEPIGIGQAIKIRQRSLKDKAKTIFNFATVSSVYLWLKARDLDAVIDQGVLQAIWSAEFRSRRSDIQGVWTDVISQVSGTDRIHICITTSVPVCRERLERRTTKHSRMQAAGLLHDVGTWDRAERLCHMIMRELHSAYLRRGVAPRIIEVDGDGEPQAMAHEIADRVRALCWQSAAPQVARAIGARAVG